MLYCIVFIFGTNRLLSSPIQRHVLRLRKKLSAPPSKVGHDDDLTRMASRNKRYVLYCTILSYAINPSRSIKRLHMFRFLYVTSSHQPHSTLSYILYTFNYPAAQFVNHNPIRLQFRTKRIVGTFTVTPAFGPITSNTRNATVAFVTNGFSPVDPYDDVVI